MRTVPPSGEPVEVRTKQRQGVRVAGDCGLKKPVREPAGHILGTFSQHSTSY